MQSPLGPWDPPRDPTGEETHQVAPPELVALIASLPPGGRRDVKIGDFAGLTLDPSWGDPPFISPVTGQDFGANSTPLNRIMSFLLPFYGRTKWLDIVLTENCWRSYSHIHFDHWNAQQAGLSDAQFAALMAYAQSWVGFTTFWGLVNRGDSWAEAQSSLEPLLNEIIKLGPTVCERTTLIVGKELNTYTSPDGLLDIVQHLSPICQGAGIAMDLHLTEDYDAWQGGTPGDQTQQQFWQTMHALGVGCLDWQGIPSENFGGVGAMGAHMYDARRLLGSVSTDLTVCAFEPGVETNELYNAGNLDYEDQTKDWEQRARTIAWQLCCCPNGGTNYPAVAGTMAGWSYPDGRPILNLAA
jgi:hypothetical protein